jgi:hypothetical protein
LARSKYEEARKAVTAAVDALKEKNNALLLCSSVAAFDMTYSAVLGTENTAIIMQEAAMEEQKKTDTALDDALDSSRTETHEANFKLDDADAEMQAVHTEGMTLIGRMRSTLDFQNEGDDTTQIEATEPVFKEVGDDFKTSMEAAGTYFKEMEPECKALTQRFEAARLKTSAALAETNAASSVWEVLMEGLRV